MQVGIGKVIALVVLTALVTWGATRPTGTTEDLARAEVLARVAGHDITRQEVEEIAPDQFIQAKQELHELTEGALARAIDERLVEAEAEARGVSSDELVETEVMDVVSEPTAEQVDSIYEAYRDQLNEPLEAVEPRIRDFLRRGEQARRMRAFVGQLRETHEVTNYLEPARIEVEAIGPAKGPDDAPITIVEFSDFECPFCYRINPTLDQVREVYGDQVRIVFRQFPLNAIHPHAQIAAEASLCADAQGRFWDMHDAIFERRGRVTRDDLLAIAGELGLEMEPFEGCLSSGEFRERVEADELDGRRAGVTGTPALFINGRYLSGAQPFEVISRVIDDELARIGG